MHIAQHPRAEGVALVPVFGLLQNHTTSTSSKGNCWDNSPAASFFG